MITEITKRDGRVETFNAGKIAAAVASAMIRSGENDDGAALRIASDVSTAAKSSGRRFGVEEIQDMVEDGLMESGLKRTAKEYIKYREKRSADRSLNSELNKKIEKVLLCQNSQNDNANVDENSFSGRKFESANILHKDIALRAFIRPEVAAAHMENRIYIHDLSSYDIGESNCVHERGWILYKEDNSVHLIQLRELDEFHALIDGVPLKTQNPCYVFSRDGWDRIRVIQKRKIKSGELIYCITAGLGFSLKATAKHRIPIVRDEKEMVVFAEEIRVGDLVCKTPIDLGEIYNAETGRKRFAKQEIFDAPLKYRPVAYITTYCDDGGEFVYDLETDSHYFIVNDFVVHNCNFIDFQRLLNNGFKTRNAGVRPANSFATACQLVAVIMQIESQSRFGGVGSCHIDFDLAPFVTKSFRKHLADGFIWVDAPNITLNDGVSEKVFEEYIKNYTKDARIEDKKIEEFYPYVYSYAMKMLEKEGKQAAQALYHNLGTLESRAGSQIPFSSLNFGLDTSPEGRLATRWLLEASIEGIGKNRSTPIFPITIFMHKKGVNANEGDPNYDLKLLAIKSLSKRIYPNIVNCDFSQNVPEPGNPDTEMATMGCRTMLFKDRFGLGYSKVGRGNAAPATINLPKIGIKYGVCLGERTKPDIEGFWKELDKVLALAERSLTDRFFHMCAQSVKSAPFLYQNGSVADYEKANLHGIYESLKHFTLAIGYIGVAETATALFGKNHARDKNVLDFSMEIVKRIYDYCAEAGERNNLNFSCYAAPGESLCKTFAKANKKEFGEIKDVTDRDYITNSHHVPVWEKVSIYDKINIEAPFSKYALGGNILYVELESAIMNNLKAIEDIIDYAMSRDASYLAINFPIDTCLKCGYQGEIDYNCPVCSNTDIQRLRRVTGYLSTDYRNFNKGKIAECLDRINHSKYTELYL